MRKRILLLVFGVTALVVLAFAIPLTILIRTVVVQRAERSLGEQADRLAFYLRGSSSVSTSYIQSYLADLPQTADRSTSVILPDGTVLGREPPGGGDLPSSLPAGDRGSPGGPPRTPTTPYAGGRLAQAFVPSTTEDRPYVVRVYASNSALRSGENGWFLLLGGGSLALLTAGLVGGELVTRRLVRPLVETADTAHRMSAGDVTARAPVAGPREVAEVGRALNRLGDRIDQLIAEERETVADMSHRLRTPLTALRLDAESLRDPEDAERIGEHVSALERTLTAVIRAARRPQREGRIPSADAVAVVGERATFWSALAEDQRRTGSVALPSGPLPVRASAEDLAAAVDALLENVFAHTPEGTPYAVRLAAAASGATLEISDSGPGLPPDAGVRGRSDRGSTGLGLDIARQVAEASGGTMELGAAPDGGASVTLHLGTP